MDKTICELFAGVGGFRVGLNKIPKFDFKILILKKESHS